MDNKKENLQDYVVLREDGQNIGFTGTLLGSASSHRHDEQKRWSELNLYRTRAGTYICEQIGKSSLPQEKPFCSGSTANTTNDIIKFFGQGWLAKALYKSAGIESTTHVA